MKELEKEMLNSLEEMNILIGHLIDDGARIYRREPKQIRAMQDLISKARKKQAEEILNKK